MAQSRDHYTRDVFLADELGVALPQGFDPLEGEVGHADAVLEAAVPGIGVHQVAVAQLLEVAQALELLRVHDGHRGRGKNDVTMDAKQEVSSCLLLVIGRMHFTRVWAFAYQSLTTFSLYVSIARFLSLGMLSSDCSRANRVGRTSCKSSGPPSACESSETSASAHEPRPRTAESESLSLAFWT